MKRTVLLVDDSRVMLMSLRQTLELGGYQVETAADGVEALARIRSGLKPNLVITDIHMPNMDGLELIRQARPILRFTPILVLTTESQAVKRDEARRLGATGWLVKPLAGQDLLQVLRQILPEA
jgi:two-component system chemotaxis response regulator CheY